MVLRVMQIYVPQSDDGRIDELLEGHEVLGRWRDSDAGQIVLHLLVPAEETEPIMDRFEQQYTDAKGFHVILFPVEAVLPRPSEPEPEDDVPENPAKEDPSNGQRISREELYSLVSEGLGVSWVFLGLAMLSTIVAAIGLLRNDVAVIIGAMVIAPLLGPNVAMALATTLGDFTLMRRAFVTNIAGLLTAFALAVACGALVPIDVSVPAISARTSVGWGDLLLAMAAGSAGTLAFTKGLPSAVIGVMVAVALVPPLVVSGMLLGAGEMTLAAGAFLLTLANVICVNLAGVATFLVRGVQPRRWDEAERAKKATWQAILVWIVLLAILCLVVWLGS